MGGRMSGESPREKKGVGLETKMVDGAAFTVTATGVGVTATPLEHKSRQQLIAC